MVIFAETMGQTNIISSLGDLSVFTFFQITG